MTHKYWRDGDFRPSSTLGLPASIFPPSEIAPPMRIPYPEGPRFSGRYQLKQGIISSFITHILVFIVVCTFTAVLRAVLIMFLSY